MTVGADVTTVGYTGHRTHTDSGLALTLYRGYDAGVGRWVSEDPLGVADGPNRLAYVRNAPITLVDPDGRFWVIPVVVGVVAGVLTASAANAPGPEDPTFPSDQGGGTMAGAAAGTAGAAAAMASAMAVVREATKRCDVRCNLKLEGPDHRFPSMGNRWCWHIRVTCYIKGAKQPPFVEVQIPIPGTCYQTKRGQGGR